MAKTNEFRVNFTSVQEELDYWKNQTHHYRQAFLESEAELNEFKESSKELENELESMLEMSEDELKVTRKVNAKLQQECETLKEKLKMQQMESCAQLAELESKLSAANAWKSENAKYIRGLEQANDDLERTNRTQVGTIEDLEERLSDVMETNAFLEDELNEKQELSTTVQRLRDEIRDLSQELSALQKKNEAEAERLVGCEEEKLKMQQMESCAQLAELESKLSAANAWKSENAKYIRGLEQANDDLERTNRTQVGTIEDLEERLSDVMETNAFLEDELDEKQELSTTVQRLRDEIRDLSQELSALQKKNDAEAERLVGCEEPTRLQPSELVKSRTQSRGRFLQSCRSLFCRIRQRLQPNKKVAMKLYSSSRRANFNFKTETLEMTFEGFVLI